MPKVDVLLDGHSIRSTQGNIGFCSMVLIEGEQRTLVDVGHVGRRTVLLDALGERGLTPADVDAVVLTHAHWDHVQNLDLFGHAPMLVHPWERAYARQPHVNDWATPRWTGAVLETHANLRQVEEGEEIEPGVRILHAPGHSPGSIAVLVDTDDGVAAVAGDVLHSAAIALSRRSPLVFWNEQDARRSIDRIVQAADVIYPGHDRPFRVLAGGDRTEYLRPLELELSGVAPDDPGVRWDTSPRQPWVMPGIEQQRLPDLPR